MVGLIRPKTIRRLLYTLVLLAVFLLQSTRGLVPRPWGATLNIFPFLVCTMAFTDGPYAGGLYGLLAGLLMAVGSHTPEGLDAALYLVFGVLTGYFATTYLRRVFSSVLACSALLSLFRAVMGWLVYYGLAYGASLMSYAGTWLLGLLFSVIPGLGGYLLIQWIARRFHEDVL